MRKDFFEHQSVEYVRTTMDKLRSSFSKEYWEVVKTVIKYQKKATIAIAFKQKVDPITNLIMP